MESAQADPHFALSFIRTVTVGFGIAPKSADPAACLLQAAGARGLVRSSFEETAITAGGEFHPALRTLCHPACRTTGRF